MRFRRCAIAARMQTNLRCVRLTLRGASLLAADCQKVSPAGRDGVCIANEFINAGDLRVKAYPCVLFNSADCEITSYIIWKLANGEAKLTKATRAGAFGENSCKKYGVKCPNSESSIVAFLHCPSNLVLCSTNMPFFAERVNGFLIMVCLFE